HSDEPGYGADGVVTAIGRIADGASIDPPDRRDHPIGAVTGLVAVRQQPVFDQEIRVQQELEPAAHRQLVLLAKLLGVLRGATGPRGVRPRVQLVAGRFLALGGAHASTLFASDGWTACILPGSLEPSVRSRPRATSMRRSMSTPVLMPMASSIVNASSVQRLPPAPG